MIENVRLRKGGVPYNSAVNRSLDRAKGSTRNCWNLEGKEEWQKEPSRGRLDEVPKGGATDPTTESGAYLRRL